jgi:hypothetical protein
MTTSDSMSADLDYLHHMSDDERAGYANGEQPPPIQYLGLPSFAKAAFLFRRLSIKRCDDLSYMTPVEQMDRSALGSKIHRISGRRSIELRCADGNR